MTILTMRHKTQTIKDRKPDKSFFSHGLSGGGGGDQEIDHNQPNTTQWHTEKPLIVTFCKLYTSMSFTSTGVTCLIVLSNSGLW